MDIFDLLSVDPNQEHTLAYQLKHQITWLIASGKLKPGDRLPPVRQLAERLGINLHTVRNAYQKLELEGLLETRRGRGTRVLPFDPRRLVQAASAARSHTVGVILHSLSNPFYQSFLQGVLQVADQDLTLVFVCLTQDDPAELWRYFAQLSAKGVDGILIVSQDVSDPSFSGGNLPGMQTPMLPIVTVDWPEAAGYVVLLDLESAGFQAAWHLLEHGHQRIGLITYDQDVANVRPVNTGYRRALLRAGLPIDPDLMVSVAGFDEVTGADGARRLLSTTPGPTAVFAITDLLAIGALRAIKESGLRVPQDIALVGFNDTPLGALVDPPLTTVSTPAFAMGQEAMKVLRSLIAGKRPARKRITLPTSLVIRSSCGFHDHLPQQVGSEAEM